MPWRSRTARCWLTPVGSATVARKRLTREESRAQTRERLLEAARELFTERGVNGSSVEQIAERAGYTRGAFYGNFADKQELVAELLEQRTRSEVAEVSDLQRRAESFGDMLELLRHWNRERDQNLPDWMALRLELVLHALRNPEALPMLAQREKLARSSIQTAIEQRIGEHGALPADPALLALIVHALEDGLLIQRLLFPDEIAGDVVVDAVDVLLRSWRPLASDPPD
ncbi:TetR/AcrR family transcriptional regulator [Pseudonocardia xinjiangensis]|uniref:TetR/AcrR family transcriptional regulator n=1 Tax=Pseudonocardia xinjiangensis TaxID=75289 RepID=UPI003D8E15D4